MSGREPAGDGGRLPAVGCRSRLREGVRLRVLAEFCPAPPASDALLRFGAAQIRALQEARLRRLVARLWAGNAFYRDIWSRAGVDPDRVRTLDDLQRLPLVDKGDFEADLRQYPPWGRYQGDVPLARVQASSGSFGEPKPFGLTRGDWSNIGNLWARRLAAQGVGGADRVQVAFTYALFIAGFSATEGAMRLGATVVPAGSGAVTPSQRQLDIARRWHSTVLAATGSYALHLGERARALGHDPARDFAFRVMVHTAEPLTAESRRRIEALWGVRAYDNYGSVESGGAPAWECQAQDGMHINEDAFVFEVVDPETGRRLPDGDEGVLVMTTLFKEASPAVRFRTGDLTRLLPGPCACGCTFRRMAPVRGRVDDMVKLRGVTVYPTAVEAVLRGFPELGAEWRLVLDRPGSLDRLTLQVETAASGEAAPAPTGALAEKLRDAVRVRLGITPEVEVHPPGGVVPAEEAEGHIKARRVLDRRGDAGGGRAGQRPETPGAAGGPGEAGDADSRDRAGGGSQR